MNHNQAVNAQRSQGGFTLVEVIVVLAVVLLLTGIAVPMISGYMEDGRRAKAEAEIKVIAGALTSFYKDLGIMPTRNGAGTNNTRYVIMTGAARPTTNPYAAGHQWATWGMNANFGDVLDDHLLKNQPNASTTAAYPTTGSNRWRGPYLAGPAPLDPWGRPYVINVISSWINNATNYKRVYVISAGPDGIFNTSYLATANTAITGDDIGIILTEKP